MIYQIIQVCQAHNWVIDLLSIPKNNLKNTRSTEVLVFEIEIDIESFIARLPTKNLDKAIKAKSKILA